MNERIRELWKQAAVRDDPDHAWTYDSDLHAAKFAGLIIQECMEWCDAYATINGTAQQIRDAIKNHFGVEESKREKFRKSFEEAFKGGVDLSGQETP
jgi:hypothetical protein